MLRHKRAHLSIPVRCSGEGERVRHKSSPVLLLSTDSSEKFKRLTEHADDDDDEGRTRRKKNDKYASSVHTRQIECRSFIVRRRSDG